MYFGPFWLWILFPTFHSKKCWQIKLSGINTKNCPLCEIFRIQDWDIISFHKITGVSLYLRNTLFEKMSSTPLILNCLPKSRDICVFSGRLTKRNISCVFLDKFLFWTDFHFDFTKKSCCSTKDMNTIIIEKEKRRWQERHVLRNHIIYGYGYWTINQWFWLTWSTYDNGLKQNNTLKNDHHSV